MSHTVAQATAILMRKHRKPLDDIDFICTPGNACCAGIDQCQACIPLAFQCLAAQGPNPIVRVPLRLPVRREVLEERPGCPCRPSKARSRPHHPVQGRQGGRARLPALVEWQIDQGTHGLVPCGTTGESPTLTHDEHRRVVELCVEAAAGRVPVIAGTGSNSTAEAVELTRHAKSAGADAVLVVTPYYNKPTQEGLYQHFKAINDSADVPIVVYNIPGRSVIDLSVETMARLFKLANIVGVKDATANMARASLRARRSAPSSSALGRRRDRSRLHGPWRAGLHLGDGQCGAGALLRVPACLPRRQFSPRAPIAGPADAAA